tara:strand:- start:1638 stop:1922 length:285 start_codon:yes stop_codon:yes gene_type:complete
VAKRYVSVRIITNAMTQRPLREKKGHPINRPGGRTQSAVKHGHVMNKEKIIALPVVIAQVHKTVPSALVVKEQLKASALIKTVAVQNKASQVLI